MSDEPRPIRRVVTGNDAQGRSGVLFDSAAPNVKTSPFQKGTNMTDIWVFHQCPAVITGTRDDGNLPFHFEPPHSPKKTEGGTWERGGQNLYTTRTHKSETLDYGILVSGERILHTDSGQRVLKPGDVVIQIGSWHAWSNPNDGSDMAFVMMGAKFEG